jgi:hypothetical protein
MFENPQFPKNEFVKKHDESYPKGELDLQLEKLISDQEISTLGAISATARLITRMKPMEPGEFKMLADEYIDFRIERKEFDKALYYSYNALVDCIKDAENPEKQARKNKILDYIALCAQKMKDDNQE